MGLIRCVRCKKFRRDFVARTFARKIRPFSIEFRKATKWSRMHPNGTKRNKRQFRVKWGGSGAFVTKNSDATLWHELFHPVSPFCTEFCNATERCQLHKNSIKHYET